MATHNSIASVQVAAIRASIAVVNLQGAVVVQIPFASVVNVVLHLDAFLDVRRMHFNLYDDTSVMDALALALAKQQHDGVMTTDLAGRTVEFVRSPADAIVTADVFGRMTVSVRSWADVAVAEDGFSRTTGYLRAKDDSLLMSDVAARTVAYLRALSDAVGINDSAAMADQTQTGVHKSLANVIFPSDLLLRGLTKPLTDSLATEDAGQITTQSYAENYCANDYVGSSINF